MRNFTTEDFSGCGQYLVRMSPQELQAKENGTAFSGYKTVSYLSTLMKKVGYCLGQGTTHYGQGNIYTLVDMSDGLTKLGYFDTSKDPNYTPRGGGAANTDLWTWVPFDSVQALCDYLNSEYHSQECRFATQEEVVRVVLYQRSRWRG